VLSRFSAQSLGIVRAAHAACRRISWALADQAASSITNFAVGAVVARSLGAAGFGVFSLLWVTYALALNVSRGLATDPLVVRFTAAPAPSWAAAVRRSSGTALFIGLGLGGVCMLAALLFGSPVRAGLLALGLVLPALLVQDSWRYAFFAAGAGHKALVNDLVWAVAMAPTLLFAIHHGSVAGFVLAWGAAGALAALVGIVQTGLCPQPSATRRWLTQHRDLATRYLLENVSVSGATQIRAYGVGALAGLTAVGTLRGAELLVGPFLVLVMGLGLVAVPEAVRVLQRSPRRLWLFCMLLGGGQAAAALTWGLALLALPDMAGRVVLGSVWEPASKLILPITLSVSCAGVCTAAATGLRALGAARFSLRAQLFQSTGYAGGGLAGAAIAGARGASWGTAIMMAVGATVWIFQLRAGLRECDALRPERLPGEPVIADPPDLRTP
jgi:O-antigen/teichoic acid export membrane protein